MPTPPALLEAVARYAALHANADGIAATPFEGLRMMRAQHPTGPLHSIYRPLVCFVLQGAKRLDVAGQPRTVHAGQTALVTVDAPVAGRIVEAAPEQPYLAVAFELQPALLADLATQMAPPPPSRAPLPRLFAEDTAAAALDCVQRLLRLLDRQDDAALLLAGIARELHYWLLAGPHGPQLRQLTSPDAAAPRLAEAIRRLRRGFRGRIAIEELAGAVHMSSTTFHRRFKQMTSLTPLQFQQRLRLIEARRLMLDEGAPASVSAARVGYASVPQFTREYARLFGAPPAMHVRQLAQRAR